MTDSTNPQPDDHDLLRAYVETDSDAAFAELVRRRIGLVYSVALRHTRGDVHRAQDATQAVFTDLARKAGALSRRPVIAGWLHRSAEFAAAGLMRAERRRHNREREAYVMENVLGPNEPEPNWDRIQPLLDHALNEMNEADRDAILLRFFDGRPFAEIGRRLGLAENTARMRVERALDKLHATLARHGITSTTAALGVALGHQASATLPIGLAASVSGAALSASAVGTGGLILGFMSLSKLQIGIAGVVAIAGTLGYLAQAETNSGLRAEIADARKRQQEVAALRAENQRLAGAIGEATALRGDDAEFARLEQQVRAARKINEERIRVARAQEAERLAQAEIDRLNREGNALVEEYKKLNSRSRDSSLSEQSRAEAAEAMKQQLAAIQAKQREVQAYTASARASGALPPGTSPGWHRPAEEVTRSSGAEWIGADDLRVVLRFPQADHLAILSIYERLTGEKVVRDPSVEGITAKIDIRTAPSTKQELLSGLRVGLERMNILLERTADGTTVAKMRSPQTQ